MAVLQVEPASVEPASAPPVRYSGRVWVRIGPTTPEAGTDDDLDLRFFDEEVLPSALAQMVLRGNNRSTAERLASLRFSVGGVPTNGALIVLGREPRDFMLWRSSTSSPPTALVAPTRLTQAIARKTGLDLR